MARTTHTKRNRLLAATALLAAGVWWWFAHDPGPKIIPRTISTGQTTTRMDVALGLDYGVVLAPDGRVYQWEQPLSAPPDTLAEPPEIREVGFEERWQTVAVGGPDALRSFALAVQPNGTLWQLWWRPRLEPGVHPLKLDHAENWRRVVAGRDFALLLKTDGELWGVGANGSGQLGMGHRRSVEWPEQSTFDTVWVELAAGEAAAAGIRDDGSLWAWGNREGLPAGWNSTSTPRRVGAENNWLRVHGDGNLFVAENLAGEFLAWGISAGLLVENQVAPADTGLIRLPVEPGARQFAVGGLNVFWLDRENVLRGIGFNNWSVLGGSTPANRIAREPVVLGRHEDGVRLVAGPQSGGLLDAAGQLRVWGLVPGWSYETAGSRFRTGARALWDRIGSGSTNVAERNFTYKQVEKPALLLSAEPRTSVE